MKQSLTKAILLVLTGAFSFSINAQNFPNQLPIPYQINSDTILLEISEHLHSFNPGDPNHYLYDPIRAFAFNEVGADPANAMTILGPSIVWNYGAHLHTEVSNNIDRVTTTHWHGAHVPQYADGGPHQKIPVGDTWKIDFEVLDKSATMWYHPHAIDITYEQVQMGLSGMIYVEDPEDGVGDDAILTAIHEILPHDYNVDDFPLILQTKFFLYDSMNMSYRIKDELGFKSGYEYLVNGVMNPYLELPANMMRLRVLNGDGKFTFSLRIFDEDMNPVPYQLIATDAGYTDKSYEMENIYIAPGERMEWLVDLRGYNPGTELFLYNYVSDFPNDKSIIGDTATTNQYATDIALMKFVVVENTLPPSPIIDFPINLHPLDPPDVFPWTNTRTKTFYHNNDQSNCDSTWTSSKTIFTIDKAPMSMNCVNDVVMVDSTEVWEIVNPTMHAHPFHIHDIHFWVIDAEDITTGAPIDKSLWPNVFAGPKDNVLVMPNWKLRFVTSFDDFGTAIAPENSYMYHCHLLPHEDKGMMGQFVVWDGISNVEAPLNPDKTLVLYPNPAGEILYLDGANDKPSQIRIFNLQGQLLSERVLSPFEGQTSFSVEDIPRGLVFVEWITDEGRFRSKVILQ